MAKLNYAIVAAETENIDASITEIQVSPNPCSEWFEITFNSNDAEGIIEMKLINQAGQSVLNERFNCTEGTNKFQVNSFQSLPAGYYFMSLTKDGIKFKSLKIIKI